MFKMKKSLVAALAGMFVVGATATTFAASNPFSDVPAGHWAYDAVTKLANQGIIEGYGDGTYRGNRNITRYEMAQMIARALAKFNQNTSTYSGGSELDLDAIHEELDRIDARLAELERIDADARLSDLENLDLSASERENLSARRKEFEKFAVTRTELDRLAAEFRDELNDLGVRVDELEKHADMVKWQGKIEYTYNKRKYDNGGPEVTGNGGVFRLEPKAEVNDHWSAIARFDAGFDMKDDTTNNVKLKRVYGQGDYDKFSIKLGRFGFCPPVEDGLAVDTCVSGAELSFGSKWKFTATGGRVGGGDEAEYGAGDTTDIIGVNIGYDQGETGLYGLASWYRAKDDDFAAMNIKDLLSGNPNNKANVWGANLGYRFSENFKIWGGYVRNDQADWEKDAWQAEMRFGNYGDYAERGDWALWAGYAKFGTNAAIASSQGDDIQTGDKGWHVGAAYAPFKNVGLLVRYADGEDITTGVKNKKYFGRVEWFF
jgi:hypothetical protein